MKKQWHSSDSDYSLDLAFSLAIVRLRQEREWTCSLAAEKAHISLPQWYKLESGKHWPSIPTLAKICEALNVTPSEFFYAIAHALSTEEHCRGLEAHLNFIIGV